MRQRRRKAQPIRAKAGAGVANPSQLCLWPGNWDTTGGTVLPRAGGDNTLLTGDISLSLGLCRRIGKLCSDTSHVLDTMNAATVATPK
ncbi:hypothetical protein HGM15179_008907 [Zosterops borbonicus]|uniref:Uncharacterized protein n=1 Tax=Zosterops borbonicus TaxID=364589 RepID=A0A8K1LLP2_9PASS|nr:hypothetical protein HGM15179_008907 [Zosterops borbonicus]